ncbi:Chitinase A1 [Cladobotryum mycophilum]|uniref:chitinase n=1 Tax=Cladobotryum mycophilum TaxID=491253 RepID=A0ABR0SRM0_9HYPO
MVDANNVQPNALWFLTPTNAASFYSLHTIGGGVGQSLAVINTDGVNSTGLHMDSTAAVTGQFWRFDTWPTSPTYPYRISSYLTKLDKHLEVSADVESARLTPGDTTGQHWVLVPAATPQVQVFVDEEEAMRVLNFLLAAAGLAPVVSAAAITTGPITVGYYPSWNLSQVAGTDLSPYSHINIAFAIPQTDGSIFFDESLFGPLVSQIHGHNAKALLSVGGWTGSANFSDIVKKPATAAKFTASIINLVKKYNLDGVDIDWEYPGKGGDTCNIFDAQNDTNNFLAFLTNLRKQLDAACGERSKLITLAVAVTPFQGPNGPVSDVSKFAKVVDFANLMQYDINGAWNPTTGPNAPLNFETGKVAQVSFTTAIDAWTGAGWPANQLVAGLPFYGRSTQALEDMTKDPKNQYQLQGNSAITGDQDDLPELDACAGSTGVSGTWRWKNLRAQGVLSGPTTAVAPWVRQWDPITQTPWLFNKATKVFLSYDDTQSIGIKAKYAKSKGLRGVMVWSLGMDLNNELINAARRNW